MRVTESQLRRIIRESMGVDEVTLSPEEFERLLADSSKSFALAGKPLPSIAQSVLKVKYYQLGEIKTKSDFDREANAAAEKYGRTAARLKSTEAEALPKEQPAKTDSGRRWWQLLRRG